MPPEFKGPKGPKATGGPGHERSRRPYDASGRRHAAARRREHVVAAAESRLRRDGYAATTVAEVARDAGVSQEFVYKSFGSKAGLVRAIWRRAMLGQQSPPAEQRSDAVSATATDPDAILRNWAELSWEVSALAGPLHSLLLAAAATDAGAAEILEEVEASRRDRMTHNAQYLVRGGFLRPGLTPELVRDILMVAAGELYEVVVLRYGWSREAYVDFVHRYLRAELLADPRDRPTPAVS